jgi:transcriptional regulator with XRE-family HTH domain
MFAESAPNAVAQGAVLLGARIRHARKRRALTLRELAAKAGVAYDTARAVEKGNLMTGIGAYFALIWAMGLENEFMKFVDPERDTEGKLLEQARLPERVRGALTDEDEF